MTPKELVELAQEQMKNAPEKDRVFWEVYLAGMLIAFKTVGRDVGVNLELANFEQALMRSHEND